MGDDCGAMRQLPGWWLIRQVWRLGLLVAGAALLAVAMSSASGGSVGWWVFGVGTAAGAGIGGVALAWPSRSTRFPGEVRPTRARSDRLEANVVVLAVCALTIVVMLVGHYGAAVGMFLLVTGVYLVESFRRHWREVRENDSRRRGGSRRK